MNFASFQAFSQVSKNVFTDIKSGLSIEKPNSWIFSNNINTAKVELNDGSETPATPMDVQVAFTGTLKNNSKANCLIDEVKNKSSNPYQALVKHVENDMKKNKGFKIIQNVVRLSLSNIPTAHTKYSLMTDVNGANIERSYSSWYFMVGKQMRRLVCTAESNQFSDSDIEFNKIAQTMKLN